MFDIAKSPASRKAAAFKTIGRRARRDRDDGTVVAGPEAWFQNSPWHAGDARSHFFEVYRNMGRRLAELKADREARNEAASPGMVMSLGSGTDAYVEAAISDELRQLNSCHQNQDAAMIRCALALAGMVKGWGLNEAEVKGRFFDVCDRLADLPGSGFQKKGPWRKRHFEEKWRNAMRKAEPRAPLNGGGNDPSPGGRADPNPGGPRPKGRLDYGLLLWKEADRRGIKGTPGERYFREARKIEISDEVMARMRFHPRVECKALQEQDAQDPYQPAILNIMTKGFGGEPAAIHATFIGPDGEKPDIDPRKQYFGRWSGTGAAIYLAPPGDDTVVLEGVEKTVAAMNATGLPGVTAGSGPAMKGMTIDPEIRTLYLGADHGGEEYAEPLAARAHEIGHEVKLSFPPAAGLDWDECPADAVRAALLDAPVWKPDEPGKPEPLVTITAATLLQKPAPPRVWLCEDWIPGDDVTLLSGDGGVGKSTLALQAHWATAIGRQWLGMNMKKCPSLYVSCEDPQREIHHRLQQFHDAELMSVSDLENLHILDLSSRDALFCEIDAKSRRIDKTALFLQIEKLAQDIGAGLITLDASADVFGGNEIDRGQVRTFIAQLRGLSMRQTCACILIAHPSVDAMKTGRGYSGSTAWNNSVRSRLYFTKPTRAGKEDAEELDPDLRKLELPKANRGPSGREMLLRWEKGKFVTENRKAATIEQAIADEELFMKLLDKLTEQKRPVSASPCSTYAPTVFEEQPEARERKVTRKRFKDAMNNLFSVGKIVIQEWGPGSKRHSRIARPF